MSQFGKLEPVDLKQGWSHEAQDFTPWLAKEANLAMLAETLDMELELEAQEQSVGPFSADILCRDTLNGSWVLIENQLEETDHRHVGQLITYAAGLQAVTIIWIAKTFTGEHRAALDWLNEITVDGFSFFGVEIELWKIGDSLIAPKFNIVSKPNEWSKTIQQVRRDGGISELNQLQLRFWSTLRDRFIDSDSPVKPKSPHPQSWAQYAIGRTNFHIRASISTQKKQLQVALVIQGQDSRAFFGLLEPERQKIEEEIELSLVWQPRPFGKENIISITKTDADPANESDWSSQHDWIADMLLRFDKAFRLRVKNLDASEWKPDYEESEAGGRSNPSFSPPPTALSTASAPKAAPTCSPRSAPENGL